MSVDMSMPPLLWKGIYYSLGEVGIFGDKNPLFEAAKRLIAGLNKSLVAT